MVPFFLAHFIWQPYQRRLNADDPLTGGKEYSSSNTDGARSARDVSGQDAAGRFGRREATGAQVRTWPTDLR
jgi:hypothetical protein